MNLGVLVLLELMYNQMDKDKKFHVVIQQLLDKYGDFSWEKHWREKERRMENI